MNPYLNQFPGNDLVQTMNKVIHANYALASEVYANQVQFVQESAKNGVENLQRFREARNATDILQAQSDCWMNSMQVVADHVQSALSTVQRSNTACADIVFGEKPLQKQPVQKEPVQKVSARKTPVRKAPVRKATATRKKAVRKTTK